MDREIMEDLAILPHAVYLILVVEVAVELVPQEAMPQQE
jgi:hypothetical protein